MREIYQNRKETSVSKKVSSRWCQLSKYIPFQKSFIIIFNRFACQDGYKPLGIPAFDPFFVDTYTLEYGGEMLSTKLKLSNVYIHGAKNIKIKDVQSKINEKHLYVEIAIIFDKLTTEGGFKGHSKFLGTSVRSDGRCKIITGSYTSVLLNQLI